MSICLFPLGHVDTVWATSQCLLIVLVTDTIMAHKIWFIPILCVAYVILI